MKPTHALLCVAVGLTACKKDEAPTAPAAAPTPAPAAEAKAKATLTFTTEDEKLAGAYDGSKAIAYEVDGRTTLAVPRECPSFSCADVDGVALDCTKLKQACPKGQVLLLELKGAPAAGKGALEALTHNELGTGSALGVPLDEKNELELTSVTGAIGGTLKAGGGQKVEGAFSATVCPKK